MSTPHYTSPVERARNYIARLDPAVSGSGGHNSTFRCASILVDGFALDESSALDLIREWNLTHCSPPWSERELIHKIRSAAKAPSSTRGSLLGAANSSHITSTPANPYHIGRKVKPAPRAEPAPRSIPFDPVNAARVAACCTPAHPDRAWLRSISPIDTRDGQWTHQQFFESLYPTGEIALIFTSEFSQGDYCWWSGAGPLVMSPDPRARSSRSDLPTGGPKGVWFLSNPVDGRWHKKAGHITHLDDANPNKLSRRSESAVTAWRYIVLESDSLDEPTWLRIVAQIPLPIAAIYTSGGKSIHTLIRIDARSKAHFDNLRDMLRAIYAPLGADPAAMTAVRLTRLPGMLRGTRKQELLYLAPDPTDQELQTRKQIR